MSKSKILAFLTGLFLFSLTTTQILAGGWPISTWSWDNPDAWKPDYKLTYVRVHLAPDVPCKGTTVTFKYENPQAGDNVSAGGENGSFTFTEDGYKVSKYNGARIPDCTTYAKFMSSNNVLKYGIAEFKTAEGKAYSTKFALNFQLSSPSNTDSEEKYPLPWEEDYAKKAASPSPATYSLPKGDISVWILNQQFIAPNMRQVTIKFGWPETEGNIGYNIFIRKENEKTWEKQLTGERGPSAKLNIKDNGDYYIKVQGCLDKIGTCVDSKDLFIPKLKKTGEPKQKIENEQEQDKKLVPTTTIVSSDAAKLQQRVDDLQKKLEESQQRQSVLEARFNQVLSWIKSVFPLFK